MQGVSPCPRSACELPEQAEQEGCNDSTTIPDFYFRKLPNFASPPRGQSYPKPATPGSCRPFTQRKIFSRQRTHRSGHARLDNGRPFVNTGYKEGGQVSKRVDNKTNCTPPPLRPSPTFSRCLPRSGRPRAATACVHAHTGLACVLAGPSSLLGTPCAVSFVPPPAAPLGALRGDADRLIWRRAGREYDSGNSS